jgi:WD40 repeat protein
LFFFFIIKCCFKSNFNLDREPQTTVKCLGTYVGHLASVTCLASYCDNLISGSLDDLIKIWDTTSKYACIKTMEANKGGIKMMAVQEEILFTVGEKDRKIMVI